MDQEPVETTLYSLADSPPPLPDRRTGERHLSLLRVGALIIGDRRELCLIRNISAGGMLIRAYSPVAPGTRLSIELKHGQPISGSARWVRDDCVGITFDAPIDVLTLLSSEAGPKQRMPRIEVSCTAWVRIDATVHRCRAVNISQGGLRVEYPAELPAGSKVVVSLPGLDPCPGVVRWSENECHGITFNRVLPLPVLVAWLQEQRGEIRAAS